MADAGAGATPHRLEVGHVAKAHGLHGHVVVKLSSSRSDRVAAGAVLFTRDGTPLTIATSRPHQNGFIVAFEEMSGRTAAEAMRGTTLFGEAIEDEDELWVHELIGATVREVDGTVRGIVESIQENPASDLLVLDSGALVPLTFLVSSSDDVLVVDTPAGLFDLE